VLNTRLLGGGDCATADLNLVRVNVGAYVIDGVHAFSRAARFRREAHISRQGFTGAEVGLCFYLGWAVDKGARRRAGARQRRHDRLARLPGGACHQNHDQGPDDLTGAASLHRGDMLGAEEAPEEKLDGPNCDRQE
jgi:hypothetical protein